jgi:hypothetical protein
MRLTPDQFFNKYIGVGIDFDKKYGFQCVDSFNQYLKEVYGIQDPIKMFPVMSAFQIYDIAKQNPDFETIENTPDALPKKGDIMIWKKTKQLPHGHVSIFIEGDLNTFTSLDQNFPLGSINHVQRHVYVNKKDGYIVQGWIRKKVKSNNLLANFNLSTLDGNKTYITVGLIVLTVIGYQLGYINDETFNLLDTLFLALLGFSLRDAIKKK